MTPLWVAEVEGLWRYVEADAEAATRTVCASACAHKDIASALAASTDGDVLELKNGETYAQDNLVVGKSVTIRAATVNSGSRPIITASLSATLTVGGGKLLQLQYVELRNTGSASANAPEVNVLLNGSFIANNVVFKAHAAQSNAAGIKATSPLSVALTDCTFEAMTNTSGTGGIGGAGIQLPIGGAVSLVRVTATAGGSSLGYGGFFGANAGSVQISDSDFSGWSSQYGGAVYGEDISIDASTFANNKATEDGGAVYGWLGDMVVRNSDFTSNQAASGGGGVYCEDGTLSVVSSKFTSNVATTEGGGGVGLLHSDGTIDDCDFVSDKGLYGGAITATDSPLDVQNSRFDKNESTVALSDEAYTGGGGAISALAQLSGASYGGSFGVRGSTFTSNKAASDGGAVWVYGNFRTMEVSGNRFDKSTAGSDGGAVYAQTVDVVDKTVNYPATAFTFAQNKVSGSAAGRNGGGLFYDGSLATKDATTLDGNHIGTGAAATDGGGAWLNGSATLSFVRNRMCDNRATTGSGGAVRLGAGTQVGVPNLLTNNVIVENTAGSKGGGLFLNTSAVAVKNNDVLGNRGALGGGGVRAEVDGVSLTNNLVGLQGLGNGVSVAASSTTTVGYSGFFTNTAAHYDVGGVITTPASSNVIFTTPPTFVGYTPGTAGDTAGCETADFRLYASPVPDYVNKGDASGKAADLDGTAPDLGVYGGPGAEPSAWVDGDKDGVPWVYDCNDANVTVKPGAAEACNGVDDDCDGVKDDGASSGQWYEDKDGDKYGNSAVVNKACSQPVGFVGAGGDCNDANNKVSPGSPELCATVNLDDDCDGKADEPEATDATTFYVDSDNDKFGDVSATTKACKASAGVVADRTDCNDKDATVYPGAPETCDSVDDDCDGSIDDGASDGKTWYADTDGDTYGDKAVTTKACAQPAGFVAFSTDCDDGNKAQFPGASETCNGEDDDCDSTVDEGLTVSDWYVDLDGDGYGGGTSTKSCAPIQGRISKGGDCEDGDPTVHPGASEVCDGADQDCDGKVDEGLGSDGYFADADGDGQGDPDVDVIACAQPDGYTDNDRDCDDTDPNVFTDAPEACNGVDDDCNGAIDDDVTDHDYFPDDDGDGHGDDKGAISDCKAPAGYVLSSDDCDDQDGGVHPGAPELCDDEDQDCDGKVDDDAIDAARWYADDDKDGFGDAESYVAECGGSPPNGYVANSKDCDDTSKSVGDGTAYYADKDADTFGDAASIVFACTAPSGFSTNPQDCNDGNKLVRPGVGESCATVNVDDDCDGKADDDDTDLKDPFSWTVDSDNDGYGAQNGVAVDSCVRPDRHAASTDDCDDKSASNRPDAPEQCDGKDNDCDGVIDEAVVISPWWLDVDADGYGDASKAQTPVLNCKAPPNSVDNAGDCNDTLGAINPNANEVCDGKDNDCDKRADDDDDGVVGQSVWYLDEDADGYGTAAGVLYACDAPPEHAAKAGDCWDDDQDATAGKVHPFAAELCDAIDNDCDGRVDEGLATDTYFLDLDGDGYGDPRLPVESCGDLDGQSDDATDCDDQHADAFPGGTEVWYDGVDQDCAGDSDFDQDHDGYDDVEHGGPDCDDLDDAVSPGVEEIEGNGKDDDCNGVVDEVALPEQDRPLDSDPPDTGAPIVVGDACGCAVPAPAGGLAFVGVLLAALLRRRASR